MKTTSQTARRAAIRLLLADNSGAFVDLLAQTLRGAGFVDIQRATNSEGAWALAQRRHPTIAVLDLASAPRTATELLGSLRREHPAWESVPIIGMTPVIRRDQLDEARSAGIGLVLTKPMSGAVLVRRIEEMVARPAMTKSVAGDLVEL